MKIFYTPKQAVDQLHGFSDKIIQSPSARKPTQVAEAFRNIPGVEIVEPTPLTIDDIKLAHHPDYVDGIFNLQIENGFGTKSKEIAESLLYTNGAMYSAAVAATPTEPTAALVSGFHHAGYDRWKGLGYFCTFNGLMVTAAKLIAQGKKVAIIDADMHWGNGTHNILEWLPELAKSIYHFSFGATLSHPRDARFYLELIEEGGHLEAWMRKFGPDVILYQAGVDTHIDDPYGGILTTEQMITRDRCMFSIAKDMGVPIAWNLAGGYQLGPNGEIDKVIELHRNTLMECLKVYGIK